MIYAGRKFVGLLPAGIYEAAFYATTGIGAFWFLSDSGRQALWGLLGQSDPSAAAAIGSPIYWLVLLEPALVSLPLAVIGLMLVRGLYRASPFKLPAIKYDAPPVALYILLTLSCAYCLYDLSVVGRFSADAFGLKSGSANIEIRTRLLSDLSPLYLICARSFIPMSACLFLARSQLKRSVLNVDTLGFLIAFVLSYLFVFLVYEKSHLLVFSIMYASTVVLTRRRLWIILVIGAVSVVAFLTLSIFLNPPPAPQPIPAEEVHEGISAAHGGSEQSAPKEADEIAPPPATTGIPVMPKQEVAISKSGVIRHLENTAQNVILRMSSGVPFYVSVFDDPDQRCGIEAHTVRRILHLPESACTLPTKVFEQMYPEVTWVQGYQPAAAQISAYGELGPWWSVAVSALIGLTIGVLGGISELAEGPVFVGVGVASCTAAYYASQLPIVAVFTYGHGLIFLMLPLVVLFVVALATKQRQMSGNYDIAR